MNKNSTEPAQDLVDLLTTLLNEVQTEQARGYRAQTAAELLDLPYRTVMDLIHSGQLGHRMAGRYYLIPHNEIKRWLNEAEYKSKVDAA